MYPDSYFKGRLKNDKKRLASFLSEKTWMLESLELKGKVCDVGCSTGEFLDCIEWEGEKYGMEVNDFAKEEAQKTGISFEKDVTNQNDFFDCVVFRGTIQHVINPFEMILNSFRALKKNGKIVFLATPNANSMVYKVKNDLPALDAKLNYYIPSDVTLTNNLTNVGFSNIKVRYPYVGSPYASLITDHLKFIASFFSKTKPKFAFWANMMDVIGVK